MKIHCLAFTLLELMITMSILSVSLILVMPSLNTFSSKNRVTSNINSIAMAIRMARESAIDNNVVTTLCRSNDGKHCKGKWRDGMIIFLDYNKDHMLNDNDKLIIAFDNFPKGDNIFWRAFQNRQYLQMSPMGYTRFQNGTFTYCPREGLQYARGVIINKTGSLRFTSDHNKDGLDEGANGKPLRC